MKWLILFLALPLQAKAAGPSPVEVSMFVAAEALIAADAALTVHALRDPMRVEDNPLLGRRPSAAKVCGAAGLSMAGVALGFWLLPAPWRDAVVLPVVFVETPNVGLMLRFL